MHPQSAVESAERAAAPWWRLCRVAAVLQCLLTAALAVYVLVTAQPPAMGVTNRVSTLGSGAGIVLAAGAAVLLVAVLLVVRQIVVGAVLLVVCALLLATVGGALTMGVLSGRMIDTISGVLIVGTFVVSAVVTVVAAATLGRTLRVARARNRIGLRQF